MGRNLLDLNHHQYHGVSVNNDEIRHHDLSSELLHGGQHIHLQHQLLQHDDRHSEHVPPPPNGSHLDGHLLNSSHHLEDDVDDDDDNDSDDANLKRHALYASKPKIWSLADTAACKTPPPAAAADSSGGGGGVWLAGSTTFPLPPTIPSTIPPSSQSQYPRFSHPMPAAIPSQYMANNYR